MGFRSNGLPDATDEDCKLICGTCGINWGEHEYDHGKCPRASQSYDWHPTNRFTQNAKAIPQTKSRECPCGIMRLDCEYHR